MGAFIVFAIFVPDRVVSSVGLERMLDRHEVGSSNLPRPTLKNRINQFLEEEGSFSCKWK